MKGTNRTSRNQNRAVNLAVASASLLSLSAVPTIVHADNTDAVPSTSGVYVTILSPNPGTDLTGKKHVEISAYYESSFGVSSLELLIDGKSLAVKQLDKAENRGEISFVIDAAALQSGNHAIVVRATAIDQEVASARTTLNLPVVTTATVTQSISGQSSQDHGSTSAPTDVAGAPTISISSPSKSDTVQGLVQIKVSAVDSSGKSPYVSLFIDKSFKTLRNFAPYTFDWDTTKLANGPHVIEVYGYNDAQQVGHASPVEVMVNNPSGHTFERHDLSDISDTPVKSVAKVSNANHLAAKPKVAKSSKNASIAKPELSFDFLNSIVPHLVTYNHKPSTLDLNESAIASGSVTGITDESTLSKPTIDLAASNKAAAHASTESVTKAGAVVRRTSSTKVPHLKASPAIASEANTAMGSGHALKSADQLDNLSAAPLDTTLASGGVSDGSGTAPNFMVVTRKASAKSVPSLIQKPTAHHAQIASAKMDSGSDAVPSVAPIVTPKVDLNVIDSNAHVAPELADNRVSIKELSIRDMHMLRGAHQVVIDNQRLDLSEPLQERGALLYAPMRQIFESQGGKLDWDQANHSVRATTAAGEVLLKIGSHHAIVNDKAVKMQGSAYLLNNRTMVPVDFYASAMNATVTFDPHSGHLVIESKN